MKVVDLSGKVHNFNVASYLTATNRPRSEPHLRARAMIKKLYPYDMVLEEVSIPGEQLFLDFYIPTRKLCIEVQGKQHRTFSVFYHGNMEGYRKAMERDAKKAEWCHINGFTLITLDDDEKAEIWEQKLLRKHPTTTKS